MKQINSNPEGTMKEEKILRLVDLQTHKFSVVCLECGKKFKTTANLPSCPNCKGSDIEVK
jgi:Zn finger protein HypA/HybF involved in hydrogenase expression